MRTRTSPREAKVTNELGEHICELLGIDSSLVKSIRLDLSVGDVARLSLWGYWDVDMNKSLTARLKEYKIVPLEEG